MPRKKNFAPIFGSSSRGASFSGSAPAGTSTSTRNPLVRESDGISQTHPVQDDICETQDPSNAHSTANSDESVSVDSYAHIELRRRGGRRSQCIVPPPNKIMPPEGLRKIRLWCYGKNSFIPYNASRRIGVIIRDHYSGPYPNWTNTPNDQVKVWWELFRKDYWWPVEEHIAIWENFNTVGGCRLRDAVRKARENVEKGKGVPLWMGNTNWEALQALSNKEDFKKKSIINKQNRLQSNALHSSGSIPISEHKRRMEKDLGREPQIDEVFKRTHKRKDGTFVNGRARDTMAKYHEGMSSQPQMTPLEVWAEAAGGMKRGKLYGLGSESSVVCGALVAPPHLVTESTQRRNAADDDLRQQVAAMSDEITQMKKKINEMENKEPSTGHASAEEIAALVFAKMSSFFPSSH